MAETKELISAGFKLFMTETPAHSRAWMAAVDGLDSACALEGKTKHLAYLAVLAALQLTDGLPFHATLAKEAGATREEVASAILIGLPAAGNAVIHALPAAMAVFDGG